MLTRGENPSPERLLQRARRADDDEVRRQCISLLHGHPSREAWEAAVELCRSDLPADRCLGADVLGQLGTPIMPYREESVLVLRPLLADPEPAVVRSAAVALGHLRAQSAIVDLVGVCAHPDPEVRHAAAFGLMGHDDPAALDALVDLTRDLDPLVRDWATFALGSLQDTDSDGIRDALVSRLDDPDDHTRVAALVGLATRRDPRALAPLERALAAPDPPLVLVDAARTFAAPELTAVLEALRASGWCKTEVDRRLLADAISSCTLPR